MKIDEVSKFLQMPLTIAVGLARAGFFGFPSKSGHFKRQAVLDFEKYGVQWDPKLPQRLMPEGIDPVVPGWENPPHHTMTEYCVSIDNTSQDTPDTHWVANFFFTPNAFYFPDPDVVQRVYPLRVRLQKKFIFDSGENKVVVSPDPKGCLALIQVFGEHRTDRKFGDCQIAAKKIIVPVLNWLTIQTDESLPILQENWVELPSGDIHFISKKTPKIFHLYPQNFKEHHPLRDAQSLYRIGLNCNEPMYAFLSFWRAYEAIESLQKKWFKHYREKLANNEAFSDLLRNYSQHKLPDHPAFGDLSGHKFNKAAITLRDRYRNAIAHFQEYDNDEILLTGSDENSNQQMQASLSTLRYVVRYKIHNLDNLLSFALELSRQKE